MIFKLRHFVPLSTLKLIYYSMFHSVLQYSLINWGRASKHLLYKIKTLQNHFLRASLFRPSRFSVNALYFEFGVLKLDDMIDMEYAKFYLDSVTICCQIILTVTLLVWILFIIIIHVKKVKKIFFTLILALNGRKK